MFAGNSGYNLQSNCVKQSKYCSICAERETEKSSDCPGDFSHPLSSTKGKGRTRS